MQVIKSIYKNNTFHQTELEKSLVGLVSDMESYSDEIIDYLTIPGTSSQLRSTLRNAVKNLNNCDLDVYERLISFGRGLRILVDSTKVMNTEIINLIEYPLRSLVNTYSHIAFNTSHKEITETAKRLMNDVATDPNEVSFVRGY
ncbi:MAG: hypothetical protein O2887_07075 [Bacteroidetes bacterium]|nr:hypothetical protein [Bacteroidota bacterium]MDA1120242.1 hypothetical protein [Bacteroidota bacterium]